MLIKAFKLNILFTALLVLFIPQIIFAQNPSFDISLSPQNPEPGELIFAEVKSNGSINIDQSEIEWILNGVSSKKDFAAKTFTFNAGNSGDEDVLEVKVTPIQANSSTFYKKVSIFPSTVDVFFEVLDGYTPPFYKGKTIPVSQSQLKAVAVSNLTDSNNNIISKNSISFNWEVDGSRVPQSEGLGKDMVLFGNGTLDGSNVASVSISHNGKGADKAIVVTPSSPEVLFYKNLTRTGNTYNRAIRDNETINESNLTVVAEPFFVKKNFKANNLFQATWTVNGQNINLSDSKNILPLRITQDSGTINVFFDLENTRELFQDTRGNFRLNIVK